MQLVLILFSSLFWSNEVHLELSVQNLIEGGIPSESHYKSLNYREGNNNSPIQDYSHSDDHAQLTYEIHICWQSKQTSQQLQSNQVKRSRR